MKLNFSSESVEGLKEVVRTSLMAVIPLLIAQLNSGDGVKWDVLLVAAAIALLSGFDKFLHKSGVKTPLDLESMDELKK